MDPELARYLNRNYWQGKADEGHKTGGGGSGVSTTQPSAPMTSQNASADRADEVGSRVRVRSGGFCRNLYCSKTFKESESQIF